MNCSAYRSENYFVAFFVVVFLYSLSFSVIAQDKAKDIDISSYKIKLSLSNLPEDINKINRFPNIDDKASLKISRNQNLLFASLIGTDKENKDLAVPTDSDTLITQPLAYILPTPIPKPQMDAKKWNTIIKSKYKNGLVRTVAPGVKHISLMRYTKAGKMNINVVEINPALNPNLSIEPALASTTLAHAKRISSIVKQNDAIVGINASFFKPSSGVPLGTLIINDELITGPIYNRVSLGIKNNTFRMAKISLLGKLTTSSGAEVPIDNVNQPRMLASYNILYSHRWGTMAPPSPKYGIQAAIENGVVTQISKDRLCIPVSGYVLVGSEKKLGKLKVGDSVDIKFLTDPDWSDIDHVVSGGPYLVKNGQIYVDVKEQKLLSIAGRNPRTAIGYTLDNRFIMVTIDGRQRFSVGASIYELARIMKEFGCYNAMNFDGGSSTQMIVNGRLVNYPINRGGNYVSNGLIVKAKG